MEQGAPRQQSANSILASTSRGPGRFHEVCSPPEIYRVDQLSRRVFCCEFSYAQASKFIPSELLFRLESKAKFATPDLRLVKMVKIQAVLAVFAAVIGMAQAECPNQCSGHGRCSNYPMSFSTATQTVPMIALPTGSDYSIYGWDTTASKKDSCTCFTRVEDGTTVYAWQGADCSERTCPYGKSWDAAPSSDNVHDLQVECSGRGLCDRSTGVCECFTGYEGKGCRRSTCPNDCSGHGRCKTLHEIAKLRSENSDWADLTEFSYTTIQYENAWDADKIQGCECDAGYKGADCSLVECPSTTDPMGGPGSESGRECSGRGICDYSSGVCSCFDTYGGDKCEIQKQSYL